ncbi:hypothetical protein [Hyphomicrobium sp. ghe19]|uniref:hypothetical protein n=1 Tax=Hyphomicrobium sp. ghe19 TaxID=2682968 RepID=UPI0013677C37|nr:hypothetical protein HYPP_02993 [Hyphomicrobium sp. ghe19]
MLTLKLPEEVSSRFTVRPPTGTPEASSNTPCFAVRIRRKLHLAKPLEFALITQTDALELLNSGGSLAFWIGGYGTKTTVYFKLKGKPQASVAVGRWLLNCGVQETCSTLDKNHLNLLRSNLKLSDNYYCKAPGREATKARLNKVEEFTSPPIVWSEYLVAPKAIDLKTFTYQE